MIDSGPIEKGLVFESFLSISTDTCCEEVTWASLRRTLLKSTELRVRAIVVGGGAVAVAEEYHVCLYLVPQLNFFSTYGSVLQGCNAEVVS